MQYLPLRLINTEGMEQVCKLVLFIKVKFIIQQYFSEFPAESDDIISHHPSQGFEVDAFLIIKWLKTKLILCFDCLTKQAKEAYLACFISTVINCFLLAIYRQLSLNGHLYKMDISIKRTPRVGQYLSLPSLFDSLQDGHLCLRES